MPGFWFDFISRWHSSTLGSKPYATSFSPKSLKGWSMPKAHPTSTNVKGELNSGRIAWMIRVDDLSNFIIFNWACFPQDTQSRAESSGIHYALPQRFPQHRFDANFPHAVIITPYFSCRILRGDYIRIINAFYPKTRKLIQVV
jgi:hypothetical protein